MSLGLSAAFGRLIVAAELAFALMLASMMCINFTICRIWVFRGPVHSAPIQRQFMAFVFASLVFRSAELGLFLVAYSWLQAPYMAAVVLVLGTSAVAKYFVLQRVVFKPMGNGSAP